MTSKSEETIVINNPAAGEIFLPNDLEELKSKTGKKSNTKGLNVASNTWKEKKDGSEPDTSEAEFGD